MLISVQELEREPIEFEERIAPGAIDYTPDIQQVGPLTTSGRADLIQEHRGPRDIIQDIRLRASYAGEFEMPCARCLDPVRQTLKDDFDLLFRPVGADAGPADHAISTSDTEIGYYQDGSLALEDVLREQVMLALPARTLCQQDCKGLCPHCGENLNGATCSCERTSSDPRWTALADLRSRLKT